MYITFDTVLVAHVEPDVIFHLEVLKTFVVLEWETKEIIECEPVLTGNASRNIPDTMCGLVGTFLISAKMFLIPCVLWAISGSISNIFLIPNNIRNNLCVPDIMRNHFTNVPDIMRNHFTNVPNMAMPILIFLCYALFLC